MRSIIWTQCLAIVALGTVVNGTLLLYLTAIGVSAVRTMIYLAILPLTNALLLLPAAFLADRYGKKRIGQTGLTIGIVGWAVISLSAFGGSSSESLIVAGITLAALCSSMMGAGWFSLLSSFDAILLGYSLMTLILVATLGLVPSMLRKSEPASLGLNRL